MAMPHHIDDDADGPGADDLEQFQKALDARQAGRELGRSERWVRDKWRTRELPYDFEIGRSRKVSRELLAAWVKAKAEAARIPPNGPVAS